MPAVIWWGGAALLGLAGWGVKNASEETGKGVADSLRLGVPIVAAGIAVYLWHKGAR